MELPNGKQPVAGDSGFWVAVWLLCNLGSVAMYDLIAVFGAWQISPVSAHIQRWSSTSPLLPFAMGLLVGHLFFPIFR